MTDTNLPQAGHVEVIYLYRQFVSADLLRMLLLAMSKAASRLGLEPTGRGLGVGWGLHNLHLSSS